MKINRPTKRLTKRDFQRARIQKCLLRVRGIVKDYDLAAVQGALKLLYEERKAARELQEAERQVEKLKKQLSK